MPGKNLIRHLQHAVAAFKWSCAGLLHTVKNETAFLQETIALAALPGIAWLLGVSPGHILLIIAAWLGVMLTELLNSALENICDLVSTEYHTLIKRAKDAGSAAVLLALSANLCFWLYLLTIYL